MRGVPLLGQGRPHTRGGGPKTSVGGRTAPCRPHAPGVDRMRLRVRGTVSPQARGGGWTLAFCGSPPWRPHGTWDATSLGNKIHSCKNFRLQLTTFCSMLGPTTRRNNRDKQRTRHPITRVDGQASASKYVVALPVGRSYGKQVLESQLNGPSPRVMGVYLWSAGTYSIPCFRRGGTTCPSGDVWFNRLEGMPRREGSRDAR